MRKIRPRIADVLGLIVWDCRNTQLSQGDETETGSLCPAKQVPILNRAREHFLVVSAEREKMTLCHSYPAISSATAAAPATRPAAVSVNHKVRVVSPEAAIPGDRIT